MGRASAPRRRKAGKPDPIFALAAQHRKLYAKMRPLEQANWALRDLPENHHRRRKVTAAMADLQPKIDEIEDELVRLVATTNAGALIEQISVFRDWIDSSREPMVDSVIVGLRRLLVEPQS